MSYSMDAMVTAVNAREKEKLTVWLKESIQAPHDLLKVYRGPGARDPAIGQWLEQEFLAPLLQILAEEETNNWQVNVLLNSVNDPEFLLGDFNYFPKTPRIVELMIARDPLKERNYTNFFVPLYQRGWSLYSEYRQFMAKNLSYDPNAILPWALNDDHAEEVLRLLRAGATQYNPLKVLQLSLREAPKRHENYSDSNFLLLKWILKEHQFEATWLNYWLSKEKPGRKKAELIQAGGREDGPISLLTLVKMCEYDRARRHLKMNPPTPEQLTEALDSTQANCMRHLLLEAGAVPTNPAELLYAAVKDRREGDLFPLVLEKLTFSVEQLNHAASLTEDLQILRALWKAGATSPSPLKLLQTYLAQGQHLKVDSILQAHKFTSAELSSLPANSLTDTVKLTLLKQGICIGTPAELLCTTELDLLKYLLEHYTFSKEELNWAILVHTCSHYRKKLIRAGADNLKPKKFLTTDDPVLLRHVLRNYFSDDKLGSALISTPRVETAELLWTAYQMGKANRSLYSPNYLVQALVSAFVAGRFEVVTFFLSRTELDEDAALVAAAEAQQPELAVRVFAQLSPEDRLPRLYRAVRNHKLTLTQVMLTCGSFSPAELSQLNIHSIPKDIRSLLVQAGLP